MTDHLAVLEGIAEEILSDPCLEDNATYYADKITAAIALMRGQSWQPIETAPKDAAPVADGAVAWGVEVDGGFDYVSTIMTSVENEAAFYGPENTIRIIPLYLHPQDASGDAEDARRYRWARDHVGGTAWNDDNFATVTIGVTVPKPRGTCAFDVTAEMLDAAIDAAMQAKEAK